MILHTQAKNPVAKTAGTSTFRGRDIYKRQTQAIGIIRMTMSVIALIGVVTRMPTLALTHVPGTVESQIFALGKHANKAVSISAA